MRYCDLQCPHASFPKEESMDRAGSCRVFAALYCEKLKHLVPKDSRCQDKEREVD